MITEQKLQPQDFWIPPRISPKVSVRKSCSKRWGKNTWNNMTISATPCFFQPSMPQINLSSPTAQQEALVKHQESYQQQSNGRLTRPAAFGWLKGVSKIKSSVSSRHIVSCLEMHQAFQEEIHLLGGFFFGQYARASRKKKNWSFPKRPVGTFLVNKKSRNQTKNQQRYPNKYAVSANSYLFETRQKATLPETKISPENIPKK